MENPCQSTLLLPIPPARLARLVVLKPASSLPTRLLVITYPTPVKDLPPPCRHLPHIVTTSSPHPLTPPSTLRVARSSDRDLGGGPGGGFRSGQVLVVGVAVFVAVAVVVVLLVLNTLPAHSPPPVPTSLRNLGVSAGWWWRLSSSSFNGVVLVC
ncbi:hypothetical protein CPC08DRAFT_767214 [Agrocybe pediades]|nr:hypothetical protein CPC08DRAFT_767214 [Agrocybe pediades]